jgi:hypothetical protein
MGWTIGVIIRIGLPGLYDIALGSLGSIDFYRSCCAEGLGWYALEPILTFADPVSYHMVERLSLFCEAGLGADTL